MRLALVCLLCWPALASADDAVKPFSELPLFTDGKGHYLAHHGTGAGSRIYWGDAREMHWMPVSPPSRTDRRVHWQFRDPTFPQARAPEFAAHIRPSFRSRRDQYLYQKTGQPLTLRCGRRELHLLPVEDARAGKLRRRMKVARAPSPRVPFYFARDDDGVYYFIDRHADRYRTHDLRLYVGRRGRMKRLKLIDVVRDAAGVLMVARGGVRLKVMRVKRQLAGSRWLVKGKVKELTNVPIERVSTTAIIYDQLGVYLGKKGHTPCDLL